ncbi:MAG: aldehyde dehydrogenase [Halieaceae bacterium]|jgi:aldehyde dehydrogenase (NAD+)|nr:aldehyde dehydrogenase [Halieaceae bacterium]
MSESQSITRYPHIINGEKREPGSGKYIPVFNPATNELIAEAAQGTPEDLDIAVHAAREAFNCKAWCNMPATERSRLLYAIANTVMANAQELAQLEVSASGGTISRVMGMDIPALADMFMVLAEEVKRFPFVDNLPARPLPEPTHTQVWREPVGVCALITAWNVPLLLFALKVAPALATGNTVVIKPSELTPTSTLRLVELLCELLPKGVLNVVNGRGEVIGDAMCRHPDIDKISFTGSTRVGKQVQQVAAQSLKRVSVELGGKGPGIVLPDADLELVAYGALYGVYLNGGQACESGTRLLVHDSIHDELVAKLAALSTQIVLGDPASPATGMGPMSSAAHGEKVLEYVNSAVEEGATVLCGGARAEVPGCEGGYFVEPTVLTEVHNGMKVAREEIFGPVLCVIKFSTEEEAIAIANDTDYGLSAGIWTADVVGAQQLARQLQAGSIWINDWHMIRMDAPFGGFKQSGYGREGGMESLHHYVEVKSVSTAFERNVRKKPLHRLVHKLLA